MSIRTKVIGSFLAILFLFGGVSFYTYLRSRHTNQRLTLVSELFLPLSRQVVQVQAGVQSLADEMRQFYFKPEVDSERGTFSRMARDLYPYAIQKKFVGAERILSRQEYENNKVVRELSLILARARDTFEQLSNTTEKVKFESLYSELRGQLQSISHRVDGECEKITLEAQREGKENLISSLALSVLVGLVGLFCVILAYRVLNPLPVLISSLKKITDGDYEQSVKVKTSEKDEISLLAREFNRMLSALKQRDKKIQAQQKELLQAERLAAVGQLSAEVVHEIRNPLNSISLNIDWLESELKNPDPEISKTVKSISREIERLGQITESYLVRARVPSQEQQKTPVNELIREIIEFEKEESVGVVIETEFAPGEIFVKTDRSRLKQAFLNVLKNAKEAMPKGGKIRVRTVNSDNVSQILFSDTGSGMNEATKKKSFQPFFTTKHNGTGLGLALTKEIVEEAHGSIFVSSQLGTGTTFTFQFPT